jgi:hypothetical protein
VTWRQPHRYSDRLLAKVTSAESPCNLKPSFWLLLPLSLLLPLCTTYLLPLHTNRTLFAFAIVDLSVAVRARYASGRGTPKWRVMAPSALVVIGSCLVGFPFFYQLHWGIILAGGVIFIAGTAGFYTLPVVYRPEGFAVPLNPFLPCLGTLANIFLIGEGLQR